MDLLSRRKEAMSGGLVRVWVDPDAQAPTCWRSLRSRRQDEHEADDLCWQRAGRVDLEVIVVFGLLSIVWNCSRSVVDVLLI